MIRRLLCAVMCVAMVLTFTLSINADALNMAGGCKTSVDIRKTDPSLVAKDGYITEGEYDEIPINRDIETTDLLLSWNAYGGSMTLLDKCEEFMKNIHFYISWDEVNGLNMAIHCQLLETPSNTCEQPTDAFYGAFPGDSFIFQYGACFATDINDGVLEKEDDSVIHRGFSLNTETGEYLTGHYGKHGYTGVYNMVPGKNFMVKLHEDNWVTYEISFPIESVVASQNIVGGLPVENTVVYFNMTATGGSKGVNNTNNETYAVSIGDGGFMSNKWAGDELTTARGYFSNEAVAGSVKETTSATDTAEVTTRLPETTVITEIVNETTVDEAGNVVDVTDEAGNAVTSVVTRVEEVTEKDNLVVSPNTGDPAVIAAVASVIAACGFAVSRKRR